MRYLCVVDNQLSSFGICFANFDRFAYPDFILSHVALPFFELVDPVENSIEGTHDQGSSEFQVLRQQHRVEEGNHL